MAIVQFQKVLAQLYTDQQFRRRFFANPQRAGEALGLSRAEDDQLALTSQAQIEVFASILDRKRERDEQK